MRAKELDQFYTLENLAKECLSDTLNILEKVKINYSKSIFIEPSAGKGVFVKLLKENNLNVICYDLDPKHHSCKTRNFLKTTKSEIENDIKTQFNKRYSDQKIIIGNPPYGVKGKLAIDFINHSLKIADIVAFVVPKTLNHSEIIQKNIKGKLIFKKDLKSPKFEFQNKIKEIPSSFQIWVNDINKFKHLKDLRIQPLIAHNSIIRDFDIKIYNKTTQAKKWLKWDWDIAIKRNTKSAEIVTDKSLSLSDNYHWILIKCFNKETLEKMKKLDYNKINDNKMTAGIGKNDIIKLYCDTYRLPQVTSNYDIW